MTASIVSTVKVQVDITTKTVVTLGSAFKFHGTIKGTGTSLEVIVKIGTGTWVYVDQGSRTATLNVTNAQFGLLDQAPVPSSHIVERASDPFSGNKYSIVSYDYGGPSPLVSGS